ncbi:MAG: DUF927 domain-containing protein [Magnetococcales bacterium]|nr:DUF927 domain-containing protein [Magnetococcales bacterium]
MQKADRSQLDVGSIREAAKGKWRNILANLGVAPSVLDGKHHPCPNCGGTDRFRFDDRDGSGSYYCNGCNPGDGFSLVGKMLGLSPKQDFPIILERVADLVGASPVPPVGKPSQKKKAETWKPITPIPDEAPEPPSHYRMGEPSQRWTYCDAEGRVLFYISRFDKPDGEKEMLPLTFCQGTDGKLQWRWKSVPAPRPLYNLKGLASQPDGWVLVTEGEKAADAANILFPELVVTTSPNGSASAHQADWSPLADRRVIVWPDHDEKGLAYANKVTDILHQVGAMSVKWLRLDAFLDLPCLPQRESLPNGWDAADAIAEGVDQEAGRVFLEDSSNLITPPQENKELLDQPGVGGGAIQERKIEVQANEEVHGKFPFEVVEGVKNRRNGTYYLPPTDDDEQAQPVWFCDPLHITARTRDASQTNHGRLLEFKDPDGHKHSWAMPMENLAGDGADCRRTLLSMGLGITPNRKAREHLSTYIQNSLPEAVARCVERTGWYGDVFVFPNETIGENNERVMLQSISGDLQGFEAAGTLADWQQGVAARCVGNSRLVFAVSAAFASVLLHLVEEESGGFNFTGQSSTGKTTALTVAVSVWGGAERLQRWRATSNGLEAVALLHNDTLLCLDELAQVDPREAGEIAYMLANGTGKARSRRDGTARKKSTWRLLFLSAGEIGLAEHMRAAGKRSRAGQEVRLADIPADAGAGYGLFENLHGHLGGADFSRAINTAARSFYGTPAREFINRLVSRLEGMAPAIEEYRQEFLNESLSPDADGQALRVAGRFALVAAAGELATALGVTGWQEDEAFSAARICQEAWITARGGTGPQEIKTALAQVQLFFEKHGESRFSNKTEINARPTINRAGFFQVVEDRIEYWVFPGVFREEICQGLDHKFVTRLLKEQGWIAPGNDGVATVKPRLPGMGPTRCYHFISLGGDEP